MLCEWWCVSTNDSLFRKMGDGENAREEEEERERRAHKHKTDRLGLRIKI